MSATDRLTRKARARLEAQVAPGEQILLSATVGPVGMVLTNSRLMMAPYVETVSPDVSIPLGAIQSVVWRKGLLGSRGTLRILTSRETLEYTVPNKQGAPAAEQIRRAIAGA